MSPEQRSYANMALSFRGAERQAPCLFFGSDATDGHCMVLLRSGAALQSQAPSLVSLSLRFSEILVAKNAAGEHQASMNTAQRLQSVIDEFHSSKHMTSKFALDADKTRSILNLMTGTTPAPG